jgi:hypothetical protein
VSLLDDAIDTESITFETLQEYYTTRDIKLINQHYKPGVKPTRYFVRAVPHDLWQSYVCAAGDHPEMLFRRSFICGVERVENLYGDDGVAISSWTPTRAVPGSMTIILSEDECNARFSPSEVHDIGSVIYRHSFLPRRIAATYLLPHSLFEPLAQRKFLRVGPSQSTASTATSSQHSVNTNHQTVETESPIV